jgi:hypothetical protein
LHCNIKNDILGIKLELYVFDNFTKVGDCLLRFAELKTENPDILEMLDTLTKV